MAEHQIITTESWVSDPKIAFSEFIDSDRFRSSNRSTMSLPMNHRIRPGSSKVYQSMFNKYLRYLSAVDSNLSLLTVDAGCIASFFDVEMSNASSETRTRYSRLLERVFGHLVEFGYRTDNPVAVWLKGFATTNLMKYSRLSPIPSPMSGPQKIDVQIGAIDLVSPGDVNRLQDWLYIAGSEALQRGDWRVARDITLASLSLGTGMRCAELILLTRKQVKYWPGGPTSDVFEFEIPGWASVPTAKSHQAKASRDCIGLMERWWALRWTGFVSTENVTSARMIPPCPKGVQVFPATLSGKVLMPSTLFRNLKEVAKAGLGAGVLNNSTRWVLERGAQGLRRAFVISSLQQGVEPDSLTKCLGHWDKRSVRRYMEPKQAV